MDATSAPDAARATTRTLQRFGRIVVVGGGCYGSYYVRQLGRALRGGAATWDELIVVDRDDACAVARLPDDDRPPRLRVVVAGWNEYFGDYLASASSAPREGHDAIVPSPLMPHLMADWLVARATARWPDRPVRIEPLAEVPMVPWQRAGGETRYVSFAEWICPINCIEPARCPETRGARSWSLPVALREYAERAQAAGAPIGEPLLFHCTHRAYGVGMIDVDDVIAADLAIASAAASGAARFLIGTVSHCHGALRCLAVGMP